MSHAEWFKAYDEYVRFMGKRRTFWPKWSESQTRNRSRWLANKQGKGTW